MAIRLDADVTVIFRDLVGKLKSLSESFPDGNDSSSKTLLFLVFVMLSAGIATSYLGIQFWRSNETLDDLKEQVIALDDMKAMKTGQIDAIKKEFDYIESALIQDGASRFVAESITIAEDLELKFAFFGDPERRERRSAEDISRLTERNLGPFPLSRNGVQIVNITFEAVGDYIGWMEYLRRIELSGFAFLASGLEIVHEESADEQSLIISGSFYVYSEG